MNPGGGSASLRLEREEQQVQHVFFATIAFIGLIAGMVVVLTTLVELSPLARHVDSSSDACSERWGSNQRD